jgi:hypothetical protein
VIDEFLPGELAAGMRTDIEAHFAEPHAHHADTHQIWNYWFVQEVHTCLRASPERIIHSDRIDAFMRTLQAWSIATLGMGSVFLPALPSCQGVGGVNCDGRMGDLFFNIHYLVNSATGGGGCLCAK